VKGVVLHQQLLVYSFWTMGLGFLVSLVFWACPRVSTYLSFGSAALGSLLGLISGITVLVSGQGFTMELPKLVPFAAMSLAVDNLAAFFVVVVTLAACLVSIYSWGYIREYWNKRNVAYLGALYNLFLASMLLVVTAGNAFLFLLVWEVMSLVSYLLVTYEHEDRAVRSAGFIYVVMTHIGTAFILLAFLMLFKLNGSFAFADFMAGAGKLSGPDKNVIFMLALIGFGTKAGLIPLHIWLPRAHPAAPSNISALMSGVMVKTAVYGIIRVVFNFTGGGPSWWGLLVLTLGLVSALLGVMYAVLQSDLKRLLAYSTVENMGIICTGLGLAMIFKSFSLEELAGLALAAALFHLLNHTVFKSLLFMGAGSVLYATHTRNMEKLGGLLKKMPWTGFWFLVGAASVAALPPLNGFVGEWLTLQALLNLGWSELTIPVKMAGLAGAAALALVGALVAGAMVKAFGITFLALPRTDHALLAQEVPRPMLWGMGLAGALCLALGVGAGWIIDYIGVVAGEALGQGQVSITIGRPMPDLNPGLSGTSGLSMLITLLTLAVTVLVGFTAARTIGGKTSLRRAETWNCGVTLDASMGYSGAGFSEPIRIIFRRIFRPTREINSSFQVAPYFLKEISYKDKIKPFAEIYIYRPLTQMLLAVSALVKRIQTGSIHMYLGYILVTMLVLLVWAR